jgi:hypothetical protein
MNDGSFNGRLRDECMGVEAFYNLAEARVVIEDYRRYCRDQRPHSSLGYRTPKAFVAQLAAATGVTEAREPNTENRVDGEEDATPLPLQTTPSAHLQAKPAACVGTTLYSSIISFVVVRGMQAGQRGWKSSCALPLRGLPQRLSRHLASEEPSC